MWRWKGAGNPIGAFGCGGLNTDTSAGQGGRTVEGGVFHFI